MVKTFCVRGRHYSDTISQNLYEKLNPKTQKLFENIGGTCSTCNRKKSQFLLMTKAQDFIKKGGLWSCSLFSYE